MAARRGVGAITKSRQSAASNASLFILTAYEVGIPSPAMRLRMLRASRASTGLRIRVTSMQSIAKDLLVAHECVLGARLPMVATLLLPLTAPDLANTFDYPVSHSTCATSGLRGLDRWHNDFRASIDRSVVQRATVASTVAGNATDLAWHVVDEVHADVAVVNTRTSQSLTDDHAISVNTVTEHDRIDGQARPRRPPGRLVAGSAAARQGRQGLQVMPPRVSQQVARIPVRSSRSAAHQRGTLLVRLPKLTGDPVSPNAGSLEQHFS